MQSVSDGIDRLFVLATPRGAITAAVVGSLALHACGGDPATGPQPNPDGPPTPPASATRLVFLSHPTDATPGTVISPAIVVTVQDEDGNVVTTATPTVRLSLGNNPSSGVLGGTTELVAVAGVAVFDAVSIDRVGVGYTLDAAADDLESASSQPFDVEFLPTLSSDERITAIEEIADFRELLPDVNRDEDNQALLVYLQSRPDFRDAGIAEDKTVWAEFSDGLPVIFTDTRNPNDASPSAGFATRVAPSPRVDTAPLTSAVPQGDKAILISVIPDNRAAPLIKDWLTLSGYEAGDILPGTLADFRNVSGADVLYISAHGGEFTRAGSYVLGTADSVKTSEGDPQPWEEYNDGVLILNHDKETGYATWVITAAFVERYWSFTGPNSLVFIDGCSSFARGNLVTDFKDAALGKGASAYLGWSGDTGTVFADEAAAYFFDRVLGTNDFAPVEDPPQRPFNFQEVLTWMVKNDLDFYEEGDSVKVFLKLDEVGTSSGILVPTIERLTIDEALERLTIDGQFGPESATDRVVTVADQRVFVEQWDEHQILVNLPSAAEPFAGDVVVTVGDQISNTVPLTGWRGGFTYTVDASQIWAPGLQQTVDCQLHFRADVHPYRQEPGQDPTELSRLFNLAQSSTCTFAMTGSGEDQNGDIVSLSGDGPLAWWDGLDLPDPPHVFAGRGDIDPAAKSIRFANLLFSAQGLFHSEDVDSTVSLVFDPLVLSGEECPTGEPPGFVIPTDPGLTGGFGIPEGSRSGDGACIIDNIPVTLEWVEIPAIAEPKPEQRR